MKLKQEEYRKNEKINLFLASVIETQLKPKYSFGRALRLNKISNGESLVLPSKNNQIDFDYIEKIDF